MGLGFHCGWVGEEVEFMGRDFFDMYFCGFGEFGDWVLRGGCVGCRFLLM
jgi:hypothetical protein